MHLVWPHSAPACFKLLIILSVLKLNFRLIFCPILALNFNFRPNSLKLLSFHLNKSTHLSSRTNQAPFKYYVSIFPLALARPVFELEKCYLDENWSESNQKLIGVLRHLSINPAFRLPMAGLSGYPPVSSVAGSVCRDPYCKDPTCPTAVYNAYMARLSAARGLPPGYLELMEAQKMATMGLGGIPASVPTSLSSSASLGPGGPYICNWMNGRDYCGKRYTSAEELLVHLKTHTNLSASDSALLSPSSAYAGLFAQSLMRQGGGGAGGQILPSAMSLQASRYSPYQRPGAPLPPSLNSLGGLGSPLAGLPPSLTSLGYPASLYALYGARL